MSEPLAVEVSPAAAALQRNLAGLEIDQPEEAWRERLRIAGKIHDASADLSDLERFSLAIYGSGGTAARIGYFALIDERARESREQGMPLLVVKSNGPQSGRYWVQQAITSGTFTNLRLDRGDSSWIGYNFDAFANSEVHFDDGLAYEDEKEGLVKGIYPPLVPEESYRFSFMDGSVTYGDAGPRHRVTFSLIEGVGDAFPVLVSEDQLRAYFDASPICRTELQRVEFLAKLRSLALGKASKNQELEDRLRGKSVVCSWRSDEVETTEIPFTEFDVDAEDPIGALSSILFGVDEEI
ncbi:MAG TPA: hypothetical protein PKA02_00735 [Candidatus Saccharibacteria bacterium]|nr:hypothetical protein [Candidatus Saccharibacteria bacterium]